MELNKRIGSGIVIVRMRARRSKSNTGTIFLKTMVGRKFVYPQDNSFIYKCGFSYLVRFVERSESDYHPVKLDTSKIDNPKFEVLPQNITFIHKTTFDDLQKSYEKKKDFINQYGQLIGLGVIVSAFIIVSYFILQEVHQSIVLGQNVQAAMSKLGSDIAGQTITPK